ncbi:MAG: S1 RNA-binding domain-containing protein [Anaerolineales bacterium]|nr:S1 RNA-binding domain-containing protein [Anaerolineales bacterium]
MESLLEHSDFSLDLPRQGEIRTGMIASISGDEILVSIGAKSEGVIPSRELEQLSKEERASLEVGMDIPVFVISPENRQGTLLLSYARALEEDDWDRAEHLMKEKEAFEGEIEGYNKGGLIVHMGRLRGFVPASQVSISRRTSYRGGTPEQRWGKMVGETIISKVIEVDRQRRRLILSERAASHESRETLKERLLDELGVGDIRTGRVTSLAEFGAFVNINGADGLVHLSEISWDRINHPEEVLKVGEEVKVKVISIDHDRKRIGLSIRQLQEDPWLDRIETYRVGQLVEGEITRLTKFGAFARIEDDLEGLIHISELSDHRVEHPKEVVSSGEEITLRIIKIDKERRRIGLSLRKVDSLAYSDLDWQLALADIDEDGTEEEAAEAEMVAETEEAEAEANEEQPEASEAEVVAEAVEAEGAGAEAKAEAEAEEPEVEEAADEDATEPEEEPETEETEES